MKIKLNPNQEIVDKIKEGNGEELDWYMESPDTSNIITLDSSGTHTPNIKIPKIEIPKIEIPTINFSKLATKSHKGLKDIESEELTAETEEVVDQNEVEANIEKEIKEMKEKRHPECEG